LNPATEDAVSEPTTEAHRPEDPPQGDGLSLADLPVQDWGPIDKTCRDYEKALIEELHTSGRLLFSLDPFLEKVAERLRPALRRELLRVELRVEEDWWPRLTGYETVRFLGEGGMGRVYQMRCLENDKEVAVKLLLGAELDRVPRLRGLVEERLAHIDHPNLVRLHGFLEDNGRTYLVMDFVQGKDLRWERGTLGLNVSSLGTRDWDDRKRRLLDLVQEITDAVVQLHQRGVMHRDLKPGNVLLAAHGTPRITDFGLAKHLDDGGGRTQPGDRVGTPFYMAPEQARGSSDLTLAVDVWALGAILYEFLTGRPPFVSEGPEGWEVDENRKKSKPVPPPSSYNTRLARDVDLDYLCTRCLACNPTDRYQTAAELAAELRRYRNGEWIAPRQSWWQWLKEFMGCLQQPLRDEDYHRRHFWNFLVEAGTSLAGHVGFFLLLSAAMPGHVLWGWLLLAEISGGWVNWLWNKGRRMFSPMERDVMQLWTGVAIADAILLYLHCPLWGPVDAAEAVRVYPAWAVTHGLVFFVEGLLCWSRLYFLGAAYFAAAVLLPLTGLWAPVAYGLLYSATFVWLSLQGKPGRPTGGSETTRKSP
jgi:serine/threonine-protein kinase